MEAERIGEPVVDVEQHADVDRVLHGFIRQAGSPEWLHVRWPYFRGSERELFEEAQRGTQLRVERRRTPVCQHRLDQLVALPFVLQGQRRDRAVRTGSEETMVQAGGERGKQLPLAHAP